jgi:hypothetical protein
MRTGVWIGCALAFTVASIGIGAQAPSSASSDQASKNTITVTGCLQSGDQGGTVGTTGSATKNEHFTLTHATMGPASSSSSSATTPPPAASSTSGTTGSTYVLEGDSSDLQKHVNQQIEVTGKLEPASSTSSPNPPASTSSSMANAQRLHVDSVKMISATCPR